MKPSLSLFLALSLAGFGGCADPSDSYDQQDDTADTAAPIPQDAAASDLDRKGGPTNTVKPVVTGSLTVGSTLTATTGTWLGTGAISYTYGWARCDLSGANCVPISGATSKTYVVTGNDPLHKISVRVKATDTTGFKRAPSLAVGPFTFPAGTVCNDSGSAYNRPTTLEHVIVILFENRDSGEVIANAAAPYYNAISEQCGTSAAYEDNLFTSDINSLSHYLALTSGSNCNTGVGTSGSGCVTDDNSPTSHRLTTESIFEQVDSYKAYQEDMPSTCNWGNPASGTSYWVKHNPPAYYTNVTDCGANDVGIAKVTCSSTPNSTCGTPTNALVTDLANDTLPAYSFITPDILNDMHDGSVTQGDNWLHTYLPIILGSKAYLRGDTAVYVLWDEQDSFNGGAIPNLFLSPYVQPQVSSTTVNHFAALRAMENQLGIATHLGCAGGTPPGGTGTCPAGSTADLRALFNF